MKIRITSFLETIIAFCILLECESVWKWMHHSGYFRLLLICGFIGALVFLTSRKGIKVSARDKNLIGFMFIYLSIFFAYNLYTNDKNIMPTLQFLFTIIIMILYFKDCSVRTSVLDKCSKILSVLAMISLFFWIFGSVLQILDPGQELIIYVSDVAKKVQSYFFLHYEVQVDEIIGVKLYRNTGIFYEGPKYALLLSIFLMYELFIKKQINYKRCIVFTVTVVTTMAMTGMYAIAFIWILYLFSMYSSKTVKGTVVRGILIIVFFVVGINLSSILGDSLDMKMATASYSTRMDNYRAGFLAWMEHPFMGAGYLNMTTVQSYLSSFRLNDVGYSNSIFRLLAQGGLYLAVMFFVPVIRAVVQGFKTKNSAILSFVLVYIYFFITTSFVYNYVNFMVLLLFFFEDFSAKQSKTTAYNMNK